MLPPEVGLSPLMGVCKNFLGQAAPTGCLLHLCCEYKSNLRNRLEPSSAKQPPSQCWHQLLCLLPVRPSGKVFEDTGSASILCQDTHTVCPSSLSLSQIQMNSEPHSKVRSLGFVSGRLQPSAGLHHLWINRISFSSAAPDFSLCVQCLLPESFHRWAVFDFALWSLK